jgi:hypothetical protein
MRKYTKTWLEYNNLSPDFAAKAREDLKNRLRVYKNYLKNEGETTRSKWLVVPVYYTEELEAWLPILIQYKFKYKDGLIYIKVKNEDKK